MDRDEPSVARRANWLACFATGQGALFGAALFLFAALASRLMRRTPGGDSTPLFVGTLVGSLVFFALVLYYGESHGLKALGTRLAWLAGYGVIGCAVALVVAWLVPRARQSGAARMVSKVPRAVPIVLLVLVVVAGWSWTAGSASSDLEPATDSSAAPTGAPADAPNIIFVMIDTLRADVLGSYGAEAGSTPTMDKLASEGALFEQAVAASSWTLPSVLSVMTSQLPTEHGFTEFRGLVREDLELLPELLTENGYACRAVVANELMSRQRGFARGFELYDIYGYACEGNLTLAKLFDRFLLLAGPSRHFGSKRPFLAPRARFPFLGTRMTHYLYDEDVNARVFRHALEDTDRPVFLYVHYLAPHSPYLEHPYDLLPDQPDLEPEHRDELWRRYVGEVAYTDRVLDELFDGLGELMDDSIVVVTSDHGEEFWEHGGKLHGYGIYEEVVRVPLIVRAPGIPAGVRVERPVSLIDVAPTLLDLVGLDIPASYRGTSLMKLLTASDADFPASPVYTQLLAQHPSTEYEFYGVFEDKRKVIRRVPLDGTSAELEIYDLANDPGERSPLEAAGSVAHLVPLLEAQERETVDAETKDLTAEDLEQLKALGYVEE